MKTDITDWKDIANAQFSKALALALALLLFAMMVTPKIEARKHKFTSSQTELVDIPMEQREKIEPPPAEVQIEVPIIISDELSSSMNKLWRNWVTCGPPPRPVSVVVLMTALSIL